MNRGERALVYKAAMEKWGVRTQKIKAIEEMGELITQLAKSLNGLTTDEKVIDEIADVKILIEQMESIYNTTNKVTNRVDYKMNRLSKILSGKIKHKHN